MKAELVTRTHIARVSALLGDFAREFIRRGAVHDQSKFTPEEMGPLEQVQVITDRDGPAKFGTPEYEFIKSVYLGPMLAHHYANNSHHPEHYSDGIAGMDLFDLCEMFVDWKAASERGGETALNLTAGVEKYNIPPLLEAIFRNTARNLDWPVK